MSTDNTPVEQVNDDLDSFSAEFFGQNETQPEQASPEETSEEVKPEVDAPLNEDDTHVEEDSDALDDDEQDDTPEPEAKPEKPKSRAEKRIEELNTKYRETERQLNELRQRLAEKDQPKPEAKVETQETTAPRPTDLNEDGTDKYPLGEFDPEYLRDWTAHLFEEKQREFDARNAAQREQEQVDQARSALQAEWEGKLGSARERYPDFNDKGEALQEALVDVDPQYGEYLASTIMQMDFGPDVLYYLANNPDEARTIVDSGALKATIALGRLESKFADASEQKQKARPKVSNAPTPPPHTNKGNAVALPEIPADTDSLDDFEKVFFSKK